jgi:uncharacterized repeat protein (TIGR01451 family)
MNIFRTKNLLIVLALFGAFFISVEGADAATINVNTTIDQFGTGVECSLREAIQSVNLGSNFGGCSATGEPYGNEEEIILSSGTYTLTLVGKDDDSNATGDLDISIDELYITGAGVNETIIEGNLSSTPGVAKDRVLDLISSNIELYLYDLTLEEGHYENPDSGPYTDVYGGGIRGVNNVSLHLNGTLIKNNSIAQPWADGYGGAISLGDGSGLYIRNSTIEANQIYEAPGGDEWNNLMGRGSAIYMGNNTTFSLLSSHVDNNINTMKIVEGGAISINGVDNFNIENSTIDNNLATAVNINSRAAIWGGGILIYDVTSSGYIENSSISNNISTIQSGGDPQGYGAGAAFWGYGTVYLYNSSIDGNQYLVEGDTYSEVFGGGIHADETTLEIYNSSVTNNLIDVHQVNEDCDYLVGAGIYASGDNAIIENSTISNNVIDYSYDNYNGYQCSIVAGGGLIDETPNGVQLNFVTVAGNSVTATEYDYGPGIYNGSVGSGLFSWYDGINLKATILDNSEGTNVNCYSDGGAFYSDGYNIDSDNTCLSLLTPDLTDVNGDPETQPLSISNMGTSYNSIIPSSSAIDIIPLNDCYDINDGDDLVYDQIGGRRFPAVDGNNDGIAKCDAGAFELVVTDLSVEMTDIQDPIIPGENATYVMTVSNKSGTYATGVRFVNTLPPGTELIEIEAITGADLFYAVNSWGSNQLISIAPETGTIFNEIDITLDGYSVYGGTSIVTDPQTGILYAILQVSDDNERHLVTLNVRTGVATDIGDLGDKFSDLAFDNSGNLYGFKGNGATTNKNSLHFINKENALTTLIADSSVGTLTSYDRGHALTYLPSEDRLYHATFNNNSAEPRLDVIDVDGANPLTAGDFTSLNLANQISSMTYWKEEDGFFAVEDWSDVGLLDTDGNFSAMYEDDYGYKGYGFNPGITSEACTLEGRDVVCDLGILPPNSDINLRITVDTSEDQTDFIVNNASVSGNEYDINSANNSAAEETSFDLNPVSSGGTGNTDSSEDLASVGFNLIPIIIGVGTFFIILLQISRKSKKGYNV